MTRSARSRPARNASVTTSRRSGRAVSRPTRTPRSVRRPRQLAGIRVARLADGQLAADAEELGGQERSARDLVGHRWSVANRPDACVVTSTLHAAGIIGSTLTSISSAPEPRPGRSEDPDPADRAPRSARPSGSSRARSTPRPSPRAPATTPRPAARSACPVRVDPRRGAGPRHGPHRPREGRAQGDRRPGRDRRRAHRGVHRPRHRRGLTAHPRDGALPRRVDPRFDRLGRPPRRPGRSWPWPWPASSWRSASRRRRLVGALRRRSARGDRQSGWSSACSLPNQAYTAIGDATLDGIDAGVRPLVDRHARRGHPRPRSSD